MTLPNVFRTSAIRLTVLYVALFGASTLALLGFVYASTVSVLQSQTDETILAEIRGLAEQYRQQGLARLVEVLRARSTGPGSEESVYLLTDAELRSLAGNLSAWPAPELDEGAWLEFRVEKPKGGQTTQWVVRARTFMLPGGYRLLVGRDTYGATVFRETVIDAMTWSLAAGLLLAVGGGLLFSRRVLKRVDRVSRTAQVIMEGDLSSRIETVGSGDEFDRLAESLNAMLDRIERLMTGMRLATDSIAHDLRSPLTRLRGRLELALRNPPDTEADRQALAEAVEQADMAIGVFDRLLTIALAESRAQAADLVPLDLVELVRDGVDLYGPLAEDKGIALAVETPETATVAGQPQLLAQTVANLLDNAIKHTPAGGRITVAVTNSPEAIALTIADDGPGVPAAEREHVLERFVRLEESRTGPGAGLGLSLVAAVCRLHDAELRLEDNEPGLRVRIRFKH